MKNTLLFKTSGLLFSAIFFIISIIPAQTFAQQSDTNWQTYKMQSFRLDFDASIFLDEDTRDRFGSSYIKGYMDGVNQDISKHSLFDDLVKYEAWYSRGFFDGLKDRQFRLANTRETLETSKATFFDFFSYIEPYRAVRDWLSETNNVVPDPNSPNTTLARATMPSQKVQVLQLQNSKPVPRRNKKNNSDLSEKQPQNSSNAFQKLESYIDQNGLSDRYNVVDGTNRNAEEARIYRDLQLKYQSRYSRIFHLNRFQSTSNNNIRNLNSGQPGIHRTAGSRAGSGSSTGKSLNNANNSASINEN